MGDALAQRPEMAIPFIRAGIDIGTIRKPIHQARETMTKKYSVWVDGVEINDHYIDDLAQAERIAQSWLSMGYEEVQVEEMI